jgi:fructose-1-phosphate kinase PfkB-like protein
MPGDFYRTLVELAHAAGKRSLIDATGQPLAAALAVPAGAAPTIVKLNREEFAQTFDVAFASLAELIAAAQRFHAERQLANLVLTSGRDGVVAITQAGAYHVLAPRQQAVNAAGAGDATSAALVWRLGAGDDWPTALRWAGATGAASVLTAATAEVRLEDVQRLLPEVQVEAV